MNVWLFGKLSPVSRVEQSDASDACPKQLTAITGGDTLHDMGLTCIAALSTRVSLPEAKKPLSPRTCTSKVPLIIDTVQRRTNLGKEGFHLRTTVGISTGHSECKGRYTECIYIKLVEPDPEERV
jgi:hypothetical protein